MYEAFAFWFLSWTVISVSKLPHFRTRSSPPNWFHRTFLSQIPWYQMPNGGLDWSVHLIPGRYKLYRAITAPWTHFQFQSKLNSQKWCQDRLDQVHQECVGDWTRFFKKATHLWCLVQHTIFSWAFRRTPWCLFSGFKNLDGCCHERISVRSYFSRCGG